jgi:nitrogen regulatory protein PII
MKKITAYIKPHKLHVVNMALQKIKGLTGLSISNVRGFGYSSQGKIEQVRDLTEHVKVEIICLNELADQIVEVIQHSAHTGLQGDGKIYVAEIIKAIRISSGEQGEVAV